MELTDRRVVRKTAEVTIVGLSPLLMHKRGNGRGDLMNATPAVQAEAAAHRMSAGNGAERPNLCLPADALYRTMCAAGSYVRGKRGLGKLVAAGVTIQPPEIDLGTADYAVDTRWATNHNSSRSAAQVEVHRPRLDEWRATFRLSWFEDVISEAHVMQVLEAAGLRVGVLSFAPRCRGPHGTFTVSAWQPVVD